MTLATKKNMTRYKLHDVLLKGNPDCTLDQWNKLITSYLLLTDKETKEEARDREAERVEKEMKEKYVESLDGEVWKPVIGYEGLYEFSNKLRVKSLIRFGVKKEHLLVQTPNNIGYLQVGLAKNRKTKTTYISRLSWEYAHDTKVPEGYVVNHISGDITDNRPDNLNIMTQKENCNWVSKGLTPAQKRANNKAWVEHFKHMPKKNRKPVMITYILTGTSLVFDSVTEACDFANLDRSGIKNVAVGKQHQTHGWTTEYLDYDPEIMMKAYWMEVVKGLEA